MVSQCIQMYFRGFSGLAGSADVVLDSHKIISNVHPTLPKVSSSIPSAICIKATYDRTSSTQREVSKAGPPGAARFLYRADFKDIR